MMIIIAVRQAHAHRCASESRFARQGSEANQKASRSDKR